ncbi:MAG: hypothetical protein IPP66_11090 [Anaerolineales bacterium]|nr:hypothetical protein [Anaerolineales bacterium]
MLIPDLEKDLEIARERTIQAVLEKRWDEYHAASEIEAALTLKLANERMAIYIQTQVFPVKDDAHIMHLVHYNRNIYVVFQTKSNSPAKIVLVKFRQCVLSDFRYRTKLNIDGRVLQIKDLDFFPFEEVEDSDWVEENKSLFADRVQSNPELWHSQNHYVVRFLPEMGSGLRISEVSFEKRSFYSWIGKLPMIYDCMAQSAEVQVFDKSIDEVLAMVTNEIFADKKSAHR